MTEMLFLSQTDNRPMYQQIIEQIKLKVLAGDWPTDFALPSIRELAVATKVSVITVKRAYTELEREGFIITRPGKGSFVANTDETGLDLRNTELNKHIDALLDASSLLGLSQQELIKQLKAALEKRKG